MYLKLLQAIGRIVASTGLAVLTTSLISKVENFMKADGMQSTHDFMTGCLIVGAVLNKHGLSGVKSLLVTGTVSPAEMMLGIAIHHSAHVPPVSASTYNTWDTTSASKYGDAAADVKLASNNEVQLLKISAWLQTVASAAGAQI